MIASTPQIIWTRQTRDRSLRAKADSGNGSNGIFRVSNILRSPSPDPRRSPNSTRHLEYMSNRFQAFSNPLLLFSIVAVLLTGCAQVRQSRDERLIAPKAVGADYSFKTWPTADTSYLLTLSGVSDTSAVLGPDFTVHYFSFMPAGSVALYNGGHPMTSKEKSLSTFRSPLGTSSANWSVTMKGDDYRAEAYVSQGDRGYWHVIVIAPTPARVQEIASQLASLRSQVSTTR